MVYEEQKGRVIHCLADRNRNHGILASYQKQEYGYTVTARKATLGRKGGGTLIDPLLIHEYLQLAEYNQNSIDRKICNTEQNKRM